MPRRRRQSVRREVSGLDLLNAYVSAQGFGCAGIAEEFRDLDLLFETFLKVGAREGSWAHEAFVVGSPRPCETQVRGDDPWGDPIPPLTCRRECLFDGDAEDE